MEQVTDDEPAPRPRLNPPPGWRFAQPWPCSTCPFRSDIVFYLYPARAADIALALGTGSGFVCHKTAQQDDDGEWVTHLGDRQCAGALATLLADPTTDLTDPAQLAERLGLWDRAELAGAPVYPSLGAWLQALADLHNGVRTAADTPTPGGPAEPKETP